jgi:hypothetical protein
VTTPGGDPHRANDTDTNRRAIRHETVIDTLANSRQSCDDCRGWMTVRARVLQGHAPFSQDLHDGGMEIARRTWTAAVKLAVVASMLAAAFALGVSRLGDVPEAAVVVPVIVVAFASSWIQTDRIRRRAPADMLIVMHSTAARSSTPTTVV